MPISKKWSHFTKENVKNKVPDSYGVYEIALVKDGKQTVLYIGEGRIKDRLTVHFSDIVGANAFRFEVHTSKRSCEKRENELLREYMDEHGALPKFNDQKSN